MSGLRFAMITTFYPPYNFGGDGMGIQRLSQALVRWGHEVTVIQDTDAYSVLSGGHEPVSEPENDGIEIIHLSFRLKSLSITLTQQFGRPVMNGAKLSRILDQGNYDVIVYHNVSLVGGPGVLAYGDALKLYMAHEHWLVCASHVLWKNGRERCTKKQCLSCVLSYKRPPQIWRYTGLLNRKQKHVDAFIAMSEFSRRKHKEFGFKRDMEVVNYFLPQESKVDQTEILDGSLYNDLHDRPHDKPYFLFVGRLEKIKGLDDVIPVFDEYEGADLLIAGGGEYINVLKEIACDNPRVHFLGRLHPYELSRYYRHAQALIVPSVCFETFGIILIESFRQGTPVIVRKVGPLPEIVKQSRGGLIFETPAQLRTSMENIVSSEGLRDQFSKAALESFEQYWSENAVIPKFLDVVARTAQKMGRTSIVERLAK